MIRKVLLGSCAIAFFLHGCTNRQEHTSNLTRATPPEQSLQLWLCELKPVSLYDGDGVIGVGDAIAYTATLSPQSSCKRPDQNIVLSGVEEVVERPKKQANGASRFLTNFQGTLILKDGTLQLRGLQSIVLTDAKIASLLKGKARLEFFEVLPESGNFTVVGGGSKFTGLVGTASYFVKPGKSPDSVRVVLYKRA